MNKTEFKRIDLSDGSPDWDIWKKIGIGGGDVGAILGKSPFMTAHQLWEFKTKRKQRPDISDNFAVQKGIRLEPIYRQKYEELTGVTMSPAKVVNSTHHWMKAALDGIDMFGTHIVEYKYVGAEVFKQALHQEKVPEHYRLQCLHYVLVTGASTCDFVCGDDDGNIVVVEITWTAEELAKLFVEEERFYRLIIDDVEPDKTTDDIECFDDNAEFDGLMIEYREADAEEKKAKKRKEAIANKLKEVAEEHGRSVESSKGKVTRFWRDGSIDYSGYISAAKLEVPEDYRRAGAWQYKITPAKEDNNAK